MKVCNSLADGGIYVLVAGFDMDFMSRPFGSIPFLLAINEYVTKLHIFCMHRTVAHYTHRRSFDDKQVLIVGEDQYEPLFRAIFSEERKRKFSRFQKISIIQNVHLKTAC